MKKESLCFAICAVFISACAHTATPSLSKTCLSNPTLQKEKSAELQRIVTEDQAERMKPFDSIDWEKTNAEDLQRRIQVAAIFAQGCFTDAADYTAAALVFQHGDTADHYYQAFLWASTAVKLGDEHQRWLTAAGLDRYLVKIGQKQLFGTQFSKTSEGIWCVEQIEKTFPEKRRKEYLKMNLHDSFVFFLTFYKSSQLPEDLKDCAHSLKPSPSGTIPGFW